MTESRKKASDPQETKKRNHAEQYPTEKKLYLIALKLKRRSIQYQLKI